ncbi:6-phosphogluconolactonase [Sulfuritortus calidifontis]|uniref:6-phosphogluconolactonase n=1 Tax=Sulfuritortus calidifontis TaxID=1914471 RepID=UPI001E644CE9|nr:6-phosphogluconolactonase [Sulfuritortus calidifontis]
MAKDDADWLRQALDHIRAAEARALAGRGAFHIVLAGGGTPRKVYEQLAREPHDWARWHVWFGDERCLPASVPERNSRMAFEALLSRVPIPAEQIHVIPAELGARAAAERYGQALAGIGAFDLVLLGLGEDGHTASLFPGHDWGEALDAPPALAVLDAPKPPPERVSLSARRLNCACVVLFLVAGAGKREAVAAWQGGVFIPAAAIRPACGVDVLLDPASVPV